MSDNNSIAQQRIQDAVDELSRVRESDPARGHYKGEDLGGLTCKEIPQFEGITTLDTLYAVLRQAWRAETAYKECQPDWQPSDPTYGQCAVTACLVSDMFGGSIHKINLKEGGTHYFNKLNGQYVDLTREQFTLYNYQIQEEPNKEIPRRLCCTGRDAKRRYIQLQKNIMLYLGKGLIENNESAVSQEKPK